MNKLKHILGIVCATTAMLLPAVSQAEVAIIVGSSSAISSSDASDIERLYLGKTKSVSGTSATALNQKKGAVSDEFNKSLLNKSSNQVKAYWSKLVFTGKGTPPKELASDAEVIAEVNSNPNAIGYISAAAVSADVKVLLKL